MSENNPKRNITDLNPLMIQSYFDNELTSEEFEVLSHDDLIHSETYQALAELRQVVRLESELALDDIDGYALLDAINAKIDADQASSRQQDVAPMSAFAPKRRTTAQVFRHWAPAFVGVALFLLSIPGLVTMLTASHTPEAKVPTVVVIDSNRNAQTAQAVVNYPQTAPQVWYDHARQNNDPIVVQPSQPSQNSQLTIEEMDTALRHLINRIENLENAHIHNLETGKQALFPTPLEDETMPQGKDHQL